MDSHCHQAAAAARRIVCALAAAALAVTVFACAAHAQTQAGSAEAKQQTEIYRTFHLTNIAGPRELKGLLDDLHELLPGAKIDGMFEQQAILVRATSQDMEIAQKIVADLDQPSKAIRKTFFLTSLTSQQELNDVQTDLRNLFPQMKVYGVVTDRAISLEGTPEDVEAAHTVITELDRPLPTYRLTYTLTTVENGQPGATQHISILVAPDKRNDAIFKQGEKVPIVTAMKDGTDAGQNTEVEYVDVGLKIVASVEVAAQVLTLNSSIEQSSISGEKGAGADPAIHETVLKNVANMVEGKPQALGSLDIPGTTKHMEITVVAEEVK